MKRSIRIIISAVLLLVCVALVTFVVIRSVAPSTQEVAPVGTAGELRTLKTQFAQRIAAIGPKEAYAEFLESASQQTLNTHDQAHAFGEALYDAEGINGLRFCDASFEFGCYHSFFGVAISQEGIGVLPQFNAACSDRFGSQNLPCQHGIGHGVLVYTDYNNLTDALELCETISDLPTGGCSSGVFMEYNFHTMDDTAGYIRSETPENPYEPCDALPQRYQMSCYFEQVQWWQNIYNDDFTKIGALCGELASNRLNYEACYNGTGHYIAANVDFDIDEIVAQCSAMPNKTAQGLCHEGASWLVRSEPNKEDEAEDLCDALEEPFRSQCFQKLIF